MHVFKALETKTEHPDNVIRIYFTHMYAYWKEGPVFLSWEGGRSGGYKSSSSDNATGRLLLVCEAK